MSAQKVGSVSAKVISLLGLTNINVNAPIFLGDSNIAHMKSRHLKDYLKYGADISFIINNADYVGLNTKDNSIEYVKEYQINNEFVKVAVRVSQGNVLYARSIYVLNNNRVKNYIAKNTLKKT